MKHLNYVMYCGKGACLSLFLLLMVVSVASAVPPLPVIETDNIFNVNNAPYNAVADGVTTNTAAIQAAINAAAAATSGVGGGTVELPGPGTYLCGPLTMKTKVNLQVDSGATLMALPMTAWPSGTAPPFIFGSSIHEAELSGSGTIDGQGAPWWAAFESSGASRANFIQFNSTSNLLIQNLRMQNPPTFHLYLKNHDKNVTIQGINIDTDPTSPNTDGMDLGVTNMLVQNCHINDGDDNIEIGGSGALCAFITITNCMFGHGHGVSMGSDLGAGVHDVTVINCVFTNSDNAIRMKSDNDRGGLVQNLFYYNIGMTNIKYAPIIIYSYYNSFGNPTTFGITPTVAQARATAAVSGSTPVWRNIIISNVTATASEPGMIWSRTELPATNILLSKLNITSSDPSAGNGSFSIYNAKGVVIVDSQVHVAGSRKNFELFNAQATFSNSVTGSAISLDGAGVTNGLAFYNESVALTDGALFGASPITLSASTITDGTSLTLAGTTPVNFTLGSNTTQVAVSGNLTLNSVLNITNGAGFGLGTNVLFTYTGSLSGTPSLGVTPANFSYRLDTATAGQIQLIVQPPPPAIGNVSVSGTNVIITGTGGVTNGSYYLHASTNVALPLSQWTRLFTNSFDASGNFAMTNGSGTNSQCFDMIRLP